jgi:hypothetical protein
MAFLASPEPTTTTTANVFHAVLGRKAVKWDSFWHLFEWLLNPEELHGLEDSIRVQLSIHIRPIYAKCRACEYPVNGQGGKGRYVDLAFGIPDLENPERLIVMGVTSGQMQKLENLATYISFTRGHPKATIRAVVVSESPLVKLPQSYTNAKTERRTGCPTGWTLTPSQIGT